MFYGGQSHSKLEKIDPKMAQFCPPHMSYAEAVAFGRKYGIIAHGVLTTTEFASIYIDSLPKAPTTEYDRVLTYDGFCEMLVRLSRKTCLDQTLPADRNLKYERNFLITRSLVHLAAHRCYFKCIRAGA
jgi:hypothetical protein